MANVEIHDPAELPDGQSRIIPGDGASLRMLRIAPGTEVPRHSHPHEQFVVVLEGGGRLDCEIGAVPLRPGIVIRLAPEAWHSAVITSDTTLMEVNLATRDKAPV